MIIKNRFTGKVLLCGEYASIKDCLDKNRGADLEGADLRGVNLRGAYLWGADLGGADLRGAYLGGADLGGAYLWDADLRGAHLRGVNLGGADLRGADLRGAKGYSFSRDFFIQLVRDNLIKFSVRQQEVASRIFALEFCWETIKKEYGKEAGDIFEKLKELGWGEYLEEWETKGGIKGTEYQKGVQAGNVRRKGQVPKGLLRYQKDQKAISKAVSKKGGG